MKQQTKSKPFNLRDRTFNFAQNTRIFLSRLPPSSLTSEDRKQLLRSSGSVGANYIEASESLSRKDSAQRLRICKKEAMESLFWIRLICANQDQKTKEDGKILIQEAQELGKIFGAILNKYK